MLLFASVIVTVLLLVIVTYHRQKLYHRNEDTPQGTKLSHFMSVFATPLIIITVTAVYEEPYYDWTVSRTEPAMEQCPAYGVLTK